MTEIDRTLDQLRVAAQDEEGEIVARIPMSQKGSRRGAAHASTLTIGWWISWIVSAGLIATALLRGLGGSLQAIADTVELHIAVDLVAAVVAGLGAVIAVQVRQAPDRPAVRVRPLGGAASRTHPARLTPLPRPICAAGRGRYGRRLPWPGVQEDPASFLRLRPRRRPPTVSAAENPRRPCPCGSGRRYKACHGAADAADMIVTRPFEGLAAETELIALREFVPSASAPLTLIEAGDDAPSVTLASVLPGAPPR